MSTNNDPVDPHQEIVDFLKLKYDAFKHMTTLGSGAIIVSATLLEKIPAFRDAMNVAKSAMVCFIICIAISVMSMFSVMPWIRRNSFNNNSASLLELFSVIAYLSFLCGLGYISGFIK